jgi:adenylosuccinate synthase
MVMGGQWGSEGKGKMCGYLARRERFEAAVCNFMPNAGHTYVQGDKKVVTCQLPTAVINEYTKLYLNAGSAIDDRRLLKEIEEHELTPERLFIDPCASLVTDEHREEEGRTLGRISSTLKGCGTCLASKVRRSLSHIIMRDLPDDHPLREFVSKDRVSDIIRGIAVGGGDVLYETAQGFDLSINHGVDFPFTTSRDVTPMSLMNELGVHWHYLSDVIGCIRVYPIRVGGPSGPYYETDQEELDWDEVERRSGFADEHGKSKSKHVENLVEKTTVTKKVRRVFTFSWAQLNRFLATCRPTQLFINFINHVTVDDEDKTQVESLTPQAMEFVEKVNRAAFVFGAHVKYVGTGADDDSMIKVG